MDGMQKRHVHLPPVLGVALLLLGISLIWVVPDVPDVAGLAAVIAGALVLVNEFI